MSGATAPHARGAPNDGVATVPRDHSGPSNTCERIKRIFRAFGPGLITGASDDDPSGIATYSQAGAQFGFSISWTLLLTYPLMAVVQEISARIGRTTGRGVAANIARHYPNWILQTIVMMLLFANTVNIGRRPRCNGRRGSAPARGARPFYVLLFGCPNAATCSTKAGGA